MEGTMIITLFIATYVLATNTIVLFERFLKCIRI